ncbi:unnamed protein product [Caenorhabditis bovis]|uniref:Cytochrome P450 n=1 Tax=Caenorhabditis bovis TaxID=2654633 RepID=A0A8S1EU83_9PELO|nr:unnamed protein product [Caenorhabditis bovis]
MQLTHLLLLFLTSLIVFYYKQLYEIVVDRFRLYRAMSRFPGPVSLPLIGTIWQIPWNVQDLTMLLIDWGRHYSMRGSGVIGGWIGPMPVLAVIHPAYAKPILESNEIITKADQYDILFPWLGTGLLTSTGEKWRRRRKMLTPAFHFKVLSSFVAVHDYQAKVSFSTFIIIASRWCDEAAKGRCCAVSVLLGQVLDS